MDLTPSFLPRLHEFAQVFTRPTPVTLVARMTGWLLAHRHRFVTERIPSSGCTRHGHHSRYPRCFRHAAWSLDPLCGVWAKLLVATFAPVGLIELAVDDTCPTWD